MTACCRLRPTRYGTPDELKALVDAAHAHGLMMFLDVVYNHFGPDGNYLPAPTRRSSFAMTSRRRGGRRSIFVTREVRRFFTENASTGSWNTVSTACGSMPSTPSANAIGSMKWRPKCAERVEPGRHVHLVLENEDNVPAICAAISMRNGTTMVIMCCMFC